MNRHYSILVVLFASICALSGCVNLAHSPVRSGMIKDPKTGLQYGSIIEKNFVTDASFYGNKKLKVRTRNTSGDAAFNLRKFTEELRSAYAAKGYEPTIENDFGLLIDVNVMFSGQAQKNLSREFAFLGATAGGIMGYRSSANAGTAIGVASGATLGSILGSFVTDDTYIIVARITFGEIKGLTGSSKNITFSRSVQYNNEKEDKNIKMNSRGFKSTYSTQLAVFAGGRNVSQSRIVRKVRERIIKIVSEII